MIVNVIIAYNPTIKSSDLKLVTDRALQKSKILFCFVTDADVLC